MAEETSALAARLTALTRYLPAFADPVAPVGEWHRPASEPGRILATSFVLNAEAERFIEDCRVHGWVLGGFDWATWAQTPVAQRLRDDPTALAHASERQLAQLLTVVFRQQRFSEGALEAAFESGLVLGILRRAKELAKTIT